ncbi:MAG: hypothetical protein J6386_11475 [Candidatus Synoicihabitans palmerolidicus]|nr:hypothetical protein [Candidatus Synoicihabitans palmerolidicus]
MRRQIWLETIPDDLPLTGRNQYHQLAGEDTFVVGLMLAAGWRVAHNPGMHLTHRLDSERMPPPPNAGDGLVVSILSHRGPHVRRFPPSLAGRMGHARWRMAA